MGQTICFQCGNSFSAKRSDARFCSSRCRMQHSRAQQEYQRLLNEKVNGPTQEWEAQIAGYKLELQTAEATERKLTAELDALVNKLKEHQQEQTSNRNKLAAAERIAAATNEFQKLVEASIDTAPEDIRIPNYMTRLLEAGNVCTAHHAGGTPEARLLSGERGTLPEICQRLRERALELETLVEQLEAARSEVKRKITTSRLGQSFTRLILVKVESNPPPAPNPADLPKPPGPAISKVAQAVGTGGIGGKDLRSMEFATFTLPGELGRFLGELDRNMTSFALTGDSGAGKSYFSFALAKLFLEGGFRVKYYSLEEGLGKLTKEKLEAFDIGNELTLAGTGKLADVRKDATKFDLLIVDSFQKLDAKAEDFEALRQDFPQTLFLIIFQKTSGGTIRGGASIKFNSSATIDVQRRDHERVAVMEKGRYGTIGWEFSISQGKVVKEG